EAYVWVAIGHRKDQDDTIGYGWYKKSEEGVVAKNLPGNQARVRAIKRWVRETFPEAKAKMKEMTATWMERAGDVRDIQNVIEAEYHIVTEESSKGDDTGEPGLKLGEGKVGKTALAPAKAEKTTKIEASAQPADAPETFTIDLDWLRESLKDIHWDEETARTWVISHFKLKEAKGDLWDILPTLTRDQAEEFTWEINSRVEKQQPKLI
ncbi:unnamed protein product, partial [marine sediment metagenome]